MHSCVHAGSASQGPWEYDIFISHAGEIKNFALELQGELKRLDLRAFVDKTDLSPSTPITVALSQAIEKAPVSLVIFNEDFFMKKWPMKELKWIVERETLLPVLHGISHGQASKALEKSLQDNVSGDAAASEKADAASWEAYMRKITEIPAVKNQDSSGFDLYLKQQVRESLQQTSIAT